MGKYTKLALTVNLVLFVLMFLLHLYRVIFGFYAQIGNWIIPIWLNVVALVVLLVVIYLNYKAL